MNRHAQSFDANHGAVLGPLRDVPCYRVIDLAGLGAPYDVLVLAPHLTHPGQWVAVLADVKASHRSRLTPAQRAAAAEGWLSIWITADEAVADIERARAA